MKVAVIAANGKTGNKIVTEAVNRGFEVTAVFRHENQTIAQHELKKDLYDLTAGDLKEFDVVVDAFGVWDPEKLTEHTTSLLHLADALSQTDTRLLVVGGAGSLYVDKAHTVQLKDTPDFPETFFPLAAQMSVALTELRKRDDVNWVYISPAADFQADGQRTGTYALAGEELTVNDAGDSYISYADYAIAVVDEIEKGTHKQERISVYQKN